MQKRPFFEPIIHHIVGQSWKKWGAGVEYHNTLSKLVLWYRPLKVHRNFSSWQTFQNPKKDFRFQYFFRKAKDCFQNDWDCLQNFQKNLSYSQFENFIQDFQGRIAMLCNGNFMKTIFGMKCYISELCDIFYANLISLNTGYWKSFSRLLIKLWLWDGLTYDPSTTKLLRFNWDIEVLSSAIL